MNALWIILGLGIFAVLAKAIGWSLGHNQQPDLGFVSHQWIAEHRLSQTQDRR